MARRWQLRTWTKGTGAAVEPFGAEDAPRAPAQPGRLRPMPPKGRELPQAAGPPAGTHLTAPLARRKHALRYMDARTTAALEALEERLLAGASPQSIDSKRLPTDCLARR